MVVSDEFILFHIDWEWKDWKGKGHNHYRVDHEKRILLESKKKGKLEVDSISKVSTKKTREREKNSMRK